MNKKLILMMGVLLAVTVLMAGCGGGQSTADKEQEQIEKIDKDLGLLEDDSGADDLRTQVESMIRDQFPAQAQQAWGVAAVVNDVTCAEHGGDTGSYECFVGASYAEAGEVVPMDMPVSATCDERNCTWRAQS
jgi:hypothetical protein